MLNVVVEGVTTYQIKLLRFYNILSRGLDAPSYIPCRVRPHITNTTNIDVMRTDNNSGHKLHQPTKSAQAFLKKPARTDLPH